MLSRVVGRVRRAVEMPNKSAVVRHFLREAARGARLSSAEPEDYVHAGYRWLRMAQEASPDRGVAAYFRPTTGWSLSYAETTGYIIPTFLEYARRYDCEEARNRAEEMADWECEVQLPTGAVRSGTMARSPSPAVFNTGQVLFGWCAMYQERPDASREAAARKAAAWMLEVQDEDGAWRKNLSALVLNPLNTYNSRAAWGLAMAGKVFGEPRWVAAAERNGDWVLGQQNEAGWWANNSMDDGEPFLHAIAYVTEGMLELGVLVGRDDFVECSRRASDAMLEAYELNGRVAGRLGPRWEYASRWRCLTGEAQLALTWLRHFELTGRADYFDAARRLNRDVTRTVALDDLVPEASGGVKGSCPFWGGYHPNGYPNHAVKFLMDSLMLQVRLEPSTAQPPVRSRAVAERPDQSPG